MRRNIVMPRQKSLAVPVVVNPFVHSLNLSFANKLQAAVMSVTLAPVRLILIILLLLVAWLFAAISVSFRSGEDKVKPLSGWRLAMQKPLVALGRAIFFVMGFHRVATKGQRVTVGEAPILVVAPHSSMFDTIILTLQAPLVSIVSRSENIGVPIIGTIIEFSQPVLVNREDPASRISTIREIQRRCTSGGQWPQIIIFPEGTCTNRSCIISFKQGAFYPGVPVQPVCLRFPNKLDTVTWTWEGPGAFTQFWLTLCQFYTECEVEYLPVYTPNEAEKADPRLFADNVRACMTECLHCPATDHTYDDCRLMNTAEKLKMPAHAGLVEFEKLHCKLGLKFDEMQELLKRFHEIKGSKFRKEKAAQITFEEFSDYLHLPKSEALQQVFDMYDRDGSGTIDFREYVIGLSLVSAPVNNDDTIQLAFQLFDTDNNGYISQKELQVLLGKAFDIAQEDAEKLFMEINTSNDGKITLEEFKSYAKKKPEYAKIFTTYQELKAQELQVSLNNDKLDDDDDQAAEFEQWGSRPQGNGSAKKLQ